MLISFRLGWDLSASLEKIQMKEKVGVLRIRFTGVGRWGNSKGDDPLGLL